MSRSQHWRLAIWGLLAILLLVFFFRGMDFPALGRALASANPLWCAAVVGSTVLLYLVRAWRWGYLLAPLGHVPYGRLFSATLVGFMTGLVVPRAGEVVRPYLVGRSQGIRLSAAFASIILERLFDLITVLALFSLYLYVLPMPAAQRPGPLASLKFAGALTTAGALAILAVLTVFHFHAEQAMAFVDRLLVRFPAWLAAPVSARLREFGDGLAVLQAPAAHLAAILAQSVVLWLVIGSGVYFSNRAFGIELPFRTAFLIMGFLTVGVAVPTPGMVGGFHAAYLLALTEAFGVDKETAAAAGIASHALTNLPVLVLGLVFFFGGGADGLTFGKVAEMADGDTPKQSGDLMVATGATPEPKL